MIGPEETELTGNHLSEEVQPSRNGVKIPRTVHHPPPPLSQAPFLTGDFLDSYFCITTNIKQLEKCLKLESHTLFYVYNSTIVQ